MNGLQKEKGILYGKYILGNKIVARTDSCQKITLYYFNRILKKSYSFLYGKRISLG